MIYKSRFCLLSFLFFSLLPLQGNAERRPITVLDASTSGKLVRISAGGRAGLAIYEPVLFSAADRKVAAGRVIRLDEGSAVVAVLETYSSESPAIDFEYEILYGEPFPEAANLPDYVADRESAEDNPANERFFTPTGEELNPELDDDSYTPETTLRPKLPEPRSYSPHNITLAVQLFRNRALPTEDNTNPNAAGNSTYTTYQGYSLRYAYTFRTHYWLRINAPALLSAEFHTGVYNFDHTFPGNQLNSTTQIRVIPLGVNLRYLIELSKMFRLYPYIGYENNIVSAVNGEVEGLAPLRGGRLLGGAGGQMVVSNSLDARLQGGSDGALFGLVMKF